MTASLNLPTELPTGAPPSAFSLIFIKSGRLRPKAVGLRPLAARRAQPAMPSWSANASRLGATMSNTVSPTGAIGPPGPNSAGLGM